jgi:hypothetical protein
MFRRPENTRAQKPNNFSYELVLRLFMVTPEKLWGSEEDQEHVLSLFFNGTSGGAVNMFCLQKDCTEVLFPFSNSLASRSPLPDPPVLLPPRVQRARTAEAAGVLPLSLPARVPASVSCQLRRAR